LTNFRHLALISLIDRLIHKTTYKVNVVTRNIKHMGHHGRIYRGGRRGRPNRRNFSSGINRIKFVFAKTTYRDGDLGGEGDRPPPLKKLGGGDGGAVIFNI